MLKITTQTDATRTIFELEGRLAGAWVQELEDCWRKAANSDRPVRVMVCAVTFIDDKGITPYRLSALPQGDIAVARGISDVLKNRMIHPKTEAVVFTRKSLPEKSS